jgi:dextranase
MERAPRPNRRQFLRLSATAAATTLLAACSRQTGGEGSAPTSVASAPAATASATTGAATPTAAAATTSTATLTAVEALLAATAVPPTPEPTALPPPTGVLEGVATDKAMYSPGEPVTITVDLLNRSGAPFAGEVALAFFHLGEAVAEEQLQPVDALTPDAASSLTFTWTPPATDFRGYRVEVQARDAAGATVIDTAATAVDVSSDWKRFPRYGFVSRFDGSVDPQAVMAALNRYHLNGIQFYDWQWQHHRPTRPRPPGPTSRTA